MTKCRYCGNTDGRVFTFTYPGGGHSKLDCRRCKGHASQVLAVSVAGRHGDTLSKEE